MSVLRIAHINDDIQKNFKEILLLIFAPENMMVSSKTVNLNGGASGPKSEVVESVARVGLEVVADVWGRVEPSRG